MTKKRNKRDTAVALKYNSEEGEKPPKVVAKGYGAAAKNIIETAEKHNVTVERDDDLVELLAQIDIDREIPQELYAAVAEILCWVYKANSNAQKKGPL